MKDATSIDETKLRNFRAKKEEYRNLREQSIANEQERIRDFCTEFEISPKELVQPLLKKGRGRPAKPQTSKEE